MPDKTEVCVVCLRTDFGLGVVDPRLTEFHEELCDYSYSSNSMDLRFCMQCNHMLKKIYNFKEKCVLAMNILQKWKKKKTEMKPLKLLYTLVPQSRLGIWSSTNAKVYSFEEEPHTAPHNINPSVSHRIKPSPQKTKNPRSKSKLHLTQPSCEPVEKSMPIDVKQEIKCKQDLQTRETEVDISFDNLPDQINSKNNTVSENNDIQLQIADDIKLVEYLDESILISDDDVEPNDCLDDTLDPDEDIETDCSVSDEIHEIDIALEDSINDNVHNDDKINNQRHITNKKETLNHSVDDSFINNETETHSISESDDDVKLDTKRHSTRIKRSLNELANNSSINNETESQEDENEQNTAKKIISDMENVIVELDSINGHYKKIVVESGNIVQDKAAVEIISENKQHLSSQGFAKIVKLMKNKIDVIQENCQKVNAIENSQPIDERRRALKDNLKAKFESCGELKLASGVVIDKEHILHCLDGKVSEYLVNWLWKTVKSKQKLTPNAIKILGLIQDKYNTSKYESVFDIEYLNSKEAKVAEFQRRPTYQWYTMAKHKCEMCYTAFRYEKHLEKHLMKYHNESAGDLVCPICGVRHKLRSDHKSHLHFHEAVYKCKLCPLVTYYKNSMRHHYDQHTGVTYRCEPCNKTFPSISSYNTHRAYKHIRPHVCTACGCTFETEDVLNAHKIRVHNGEQPTDISTSVKCDKCELSFPSREVCERHCRFSHGSGYYRTPTSHEYLQKVSKAVDKPRITRRAVHTCPVCKATGNTYGWLMLHGRLEHKEDLSDAYAAKREHLCDVCGRGFSTKYVLRDHMNMHTGARPFACPACPKRFHSAEKLRYHRQYHAPPAFVCARCGKKFHTPANLYAHTQGHIGNRRYKCDICGKGFLYSSALKEHVRGVHNNERRVKKRGATGAEWEGVSGAGWEGVTEAGWKGTTDVARTSTARRAKRRKVPKVSCADESGESD